MKTLGKIIIYVLASIVFVLSMIVTYQQHLLVALIWGTILGAVFYELVVDFVKEWRDHYGKD